MHPARSTRNTADIDVRSPVFEAENLIGLLAKGHSVEDIRGLIKVPLEVEATLRTFIRCHPEESIEIEHMLSFRQRVAEEFERLLSALGLIAA